MMVWQVVQLVGRVWEQMHDDVVTASFSSVP